jgi:mono/diheme cytochrome c family protein
MKKSFSFILISIFIAACGPDKPKATTENEDTESYESIHGSEKNAVEANIAEGKGIGQVKEVTLNTPLEQERIGRGKAIFEMKCQACHRLDDQRVVGPGWKDVTKRRKPEWIMNMITDIDVMLDKDPEAQKLLELCLTRMPNQNVSIGDARDVLEFMRQNDGEK